MERSERKREILAVSARLFREKGYSAVSMRDIATALHIKAASLYNHISSKQEILSIIIIEMAEEFTKGMKQIAASRAGATEKLTRLIELHIDINLRDPDAMACLNNDWMHLEKDELSYFLKLRNGYEDNFRKILKKGIAGKEIKEPNVEVILFSMLSTLRTLYLWYGRKKGIDPGDLKASMTRVLLKGIV